MRPGRLRYRTAAAGNPGSVVESAYSSPIVGGGTSVPLVTGSGRPGLVLLALLVLGLGAFAYWTR